MGYPREVIEQVKEAVCKEAAEMRRINKIVPVTGKRLQITQPDRQIDVVFLSIRERTCTVDSWFPRRWISVWRMCYE